MIEISIFYLVGLVIMLPTTSILSTKLFYKNKIHELERKVWILENGDLDVTKLINDVESKKELSFQDKQEIIENFLKHKN